MKSWLFRGAVLLAANVAALCVLGFHRTTDAAPTDVRQPFANSVTQREQMIRELREIKELLKEQNALMRVQDDKQQDQKTGRKS